MPDRPNIVLITSDQHRADAMACAGHPAVQTPHLDLLAYQGTRFANCHVDAPVCIPSRTALVTGRRAHELGCSEYSMDFRAPVPREDWLGSLLTAAGYQTELVGKTHWYADPSFRGGFEHVTWFSELRKQQLVEMGRPGMLTGMGYNEFNPVLSPFPDHLDPTDWAIDRANGFLETREEGTPFALWVSVHTPHPPMTLREPYFSLYRDTDLPEAVVPGWVGTDEEPLEHLMSRWALNKKPFNAEELHRIQAAYLGMVTHLDHQIGRLIAQLQMTGAWENTLLVYSSDHGEMLGDAGMLGKRSFLSASAKVPMTVRPPASWGQEPGRVSDDLVEWVDVLPTLCEAAGARVPDACTGRSMLPVMRGDTPAPHTMHGQLGGRHMLHDGRHKLLYDVIDGATQCFDTVEDPHELHPLGGEPEDRLRARLIEHLSETDDPDVVDGELRNENRPRPSVAELRSKDQAGLGATEHLGQIGRDVMWIH